MPQQEYRPNPDGESRFNERLLPLVLPSNGAVESEQLLSKRTAELLLEVIGCCPDACVLRVLRADLRNSISEVNLARSEFCHEACFEDLKSIYSFYKLDIKRDLFAALVGSLAIPDAQDPVSQTVSFQYASKLSLSEKMTAFKALIDSDPNFPSKDFPGLLLIYKQKAITEVGAIFREFTREQNAAFIKAMCRRDWTGNGKSEAAVIFFESALGHPEFLRILRGVNEVLREEDDGGDRTFATRRTLMHLMAISVKRHPEFSVNYGFAAYCYQHCHLDNDRNMLTKLFGQRYPEMSERFLMEIIASGGRDLKAQAAFDYTELTKASRSGVFPGLLTHSEPRVVQAACEAAALNFDRAQMEVLSSILIAAPDEAAVIVAALFKNATFSKNASKALDQVLARIDITPFIRRLDLLGDLGFYRRAKGEIVPNEDEDFAQLLLRYGPDRLISKIFESDNRVTIKNVLRLIDYMYDKKLRAEIKDKLLEPNKKEFSNQAEFYANLAQLYRKLK